MVEEKDFFSGSSLVAKKLNRKMCGCVEFGKGEIEEDFHLTCLECASEYLLSEWQEFARHIKEQHQKLIDLQCSDNRLAGIKVENEEEETTCPENEISNNSTVLFTDTLEQCVEVECDSQGDNSVGMSENDEDSDPINQSDQSTTTSTTPSASKRSKTSKAAGLQSQKSGKLFLCKANSSLMKDFLITLKDHSILWHGRQSTQKHFDDALENMAVKLNEKHGLSLGKKIIASSIMQLKMQMKRSSMIEKKYPEHYGILKEIEEESKKIVFECEKCNHMFVLETDLQLHKFKRHGIGESPFKCEICNYRFSNGDTLANHRKRHLTPKDVTCEVCNRSFHEFALKAHMESHSMIICEMCGEAFTSKGVFQKHKAKHGTPEEKCDICGEAFHERRKLSYHRKTHFKQDTYSCHICDKTYKASRGLRLHFRNVHKITKSKPLYVWVGPDDKNDANGHDDANDDYDDDNKDDDDDNANDNYIAIAQFL